jgi:ankyrin repeat protein
MKFRWRHTDLWATVELVPNLYLEGEKKMAARRGSTFFLLGLLAVALMALAVREAASRGENGDLAYAAYYGELSSVKQLIAAGAPVNPRDKNGMTPLMAACLEGHKEIVEVFLANGAEVNAKTIDGETALMYASIRGDGKIVEMLIARGAEVNARTREGKTALTFATRMKKQQAKDVLIAAGAN